MAQTTITDIGTVGIPVSDQDKAVEFFVGMFTFKDPDGNKFEIVEARA